MAGLLVAVLGFGWPTPAAARHGRADERSGRTTLPANTPPSLRRVFRRAVAVAKTSPVIRGESRRRGGLRPETFEYTGVPGRVRVYFQHDGRERAMAIVDLRRRRVLEAWTGIQVRWEMARGYPGDFGHAFNSPWVLVPLGLLFLAPFVDPRRPFRLLHLDLLAILAFGISQFFFNRGEVSTSVPLVYPVLLYLLIRMLVAGLRPRSGQGPLVPLVPVTWLAVGIVILGGFRIGLNVIDSNVIDVGYASVIGADHIEHGKALYDGHFASDPSNGDTYGPVNYLAYVPFEQILPWSGKWDDVPAAHAAATAFDLLTALGLFLLGRRLRVRREGTALGTALAYAWFACPYSLFALSTNSNDTLVAMLLVFALLAWRYAPVRGVLIGLAGAAKFVPLLLAPLFASRDTEQPVRQYAGYFIPLVLTLSVTLVPLLPNGGLSEFYDRTLGFQLGRDSPFSIWGQHPSLEVLQTLVKLATVNFAAALLAFPRHREVPTAAALGAALLIGLQLGANHWFYLYVVWFLPLVLVALFSTYAAERAPALSPVTARPA